MASLLGSLHSEQTFVRLRLMSFLRRSNTFASIASRCVCMCGNVVASGSVRNRVLCNDLIAARMLDGTKGATRLWTVLTISLDHREGCVGPNPSEHCGVWLDRRDTNCPRGHSGLLDGSDKLPSEDTASHREHRCVYHRANLCVTRGVCQNFLAALSLRRDQLKCRPSFRVSFSLQSAT